MGSRINYGYKSYVLKYWSDLVEKDRKARLYDYALRNYEENGVISPILSNKNYSPSSDLRKYVEKEKLFLEYSEAQKINTAYYKRLVRLKKRVQDMLINGQCIFLTLTFTDKTLESTTEEQRRRYVYRYLKSFNTQYVANIDYGKTNHREHYHALIQASNINYDLWTKYGAINGQKVRLKGNDAIKLSKYINKLSNHAIKETTNRSALIYSR